MTIVQRESAERSSTHHTSTLFSAPSPHQNNHHDPLPPTLTDKYNPYPPKSQQYHARDEAHHPRHHHHRRARHCHPHRQRRLRDPRAARLRLRQEGALPP
jgi:hypothetical protein